MEVDRVKVRMYKKLLGDCFLISVEGSDRNQPASAHILVDCGVLQGTRGSKDLMVAAVEDIYATAGDKGLDLVVVTHEHYDHICGFKLADHLFEERGFDNLWMAWTDDPDDPDGKQLQEQFGQAYAALAGMAARFGVRTAFDDFENEALLGLAGFSGPLAVPLDEGGEGEEALTSAQDGLAAAKRARTVRGSRKIYLALKEWAGSTRYLSPGEVTRTPGAIGLRTFVLGPPRDRDLLGKSIPSSGENQETYFALAGESLGSIEPSQDEASPESRAREKRICDSAQKLSPFSPRFRWRSFAEQRDATDDGEATRFLAERYFAEHSAGKDFSEGEPLAHRRIDDAMRSTFSSLALKMDNNTNNTSLVLAFELPDDAGTMIFAADAQVGNWLSWGSVVFKEGGKSLATTSADLLRAARLYKVGHHGSHNATLREHGLEEMVHDELVALIPTDEEFARRQSGGWEMPDAHLNQALLKKSKGRILRGDRAAKEAIDLHREMASKASAERFAKRVKDTDLYVEFTVFDRQLGDGKRD